MTNSRAPEDLVDLTRYPLTSPNSPQYQQLVDDLTTTLDQTGSASLPGFLKPNAITLMANEGNALEPLAYPGPREATPYFFNYDIANTDEPGHPTRIKGERQLAQVAYDLIPPESALYKLYHWRPLPDFLAAILGYKELHQMTDHYQSLNISIMQQGGCQQWHFDRGVFVTTLLLQEPDSGGVFEYVPSIRSEDDEHFAEVKAVLDGDRSRIRQVKIQAGMMNLFKGHYSMHRVTPVTGKRRRIQTALAYSPTPNREGNLKSSLLHYGPRVAIRAQLDSSELAELMDDQHTTN